MIRIVTFLILLFFLSTIQEQIPGKYNLAKATYEEENPESLLEKDYIFWAEMDESQKLKLIIDFVNISDGNLKFQIVYSGNDKDSIVKDSIVKDIAFQMTSIQFCMDSQGWDMYYEYKSDLQIGTVMLECMNQKHMFQD